MSSIHRTLEGDVLVHHLSEDERTIDQALVAQHGRSARTLVKEGLLRLTIIEIAAGGNLPPHSAPGPVSIQILKGEIVFDAVGREYMLVTGDILVLAPGVEHSARSSGGVVLLLTVVHPESAGSRIADA
ncbi:MAG: cupin domain-containing protein [Gemmatimonadaceae bacterium]